MISALGIPSLDLVITVTHNHFNVVLRTPLQIILLLGDINEYIFLFFFFSSPFPPTKWDVWFFFFFLPVLRFTILRSEWQVHMCIWEKEKFSFLSLISYSKSQFWHHETFLVFVFSPIIKITFQKSVIFIIMFKVI